jgi:hypothetical protein
MKIVDYKTFISLPAGILYCETEPCVFGELQVKQETINDGRDWFLSRLKDSFIEDGDYKQFDEYYQDLEKGIIKRMDYFTQERDGMFDYNRKFLIYDKEDINDLINFLKSL